MANIDVQSGVSFAKTPLSEISGKAEEIRALAWHEEGRGDPWVVVYRKSVTRGEDGEAELRAVMGDYWLSADDIRSLLASK